MGDRATLTKDPAPATSSRPVHTLQPLDVAAPLDATDRGLVGNGPESVLGLQRIVGNAAVTTMIERRRQTGPADPVIRRHSSWEHALLGDTPPDKLGEATVPGRSRGHVLSQEWSRLMKFSRDPDRDPRALHPDVRWIKLKGSGLWVSYGELNALADYLPDPTTIDTLPHDEMVPVLQRMRESMLASLKKFIGFPGGAMKGSATSGLDFVPGMGAAGEVSALDDATKQLGINRYAGLLARNACHFAPFSWERWAYFQNQAREEAMLYNKGRCMAKPIKDVGTEENEHLRKAWLNNGYGDHFLQDSFAAGHLVNKTLVMQWFAEYIKNIPWIARPIVGVPGWDTLNAMTEANQPGIAGRHLYGRGPTTATSDQNRTQGNWATDPQSAQERDTKEGRMAGSGVVATGSRTKEENYQAYLEMLNSSYLQLAAGATHDYFNERGLWVVNKRGDTLRVGGDDTMLSKSGALGAQVAGEAAHLSQKAIKELLENGATAITVEQIFELVPQEVYLDTDPSKKLPLSQWQDDVVKQICWTKIFPDLATSLKGEAVRMASPKMVSGGISPDQEI
jgi:hypothetical protein